jgi:hypothetical protein
MSGAARLLDIGATFDDYNSSRNGAEADAIALAMDWLAVGDDLYAAIEERHAHAS